jgi:hypothetical protein
MSLVELIAAVQTGDAPVKPSNPVTDEYIVLALAAVVVGLIVLVFIRTSARRAKR